MSDKTKIEWCDHTFNGWQGCAKVSPGCENCYAEVLAKRMHADDIGWVRNGARWFNSESYLQKPYLWNRNAEKEGKLHSVFCGSMKDIFESHPDPRIMETRNRIFSMVPETPNLMWLFLTKRPENVNRMIPENWFLSGWPENTMLGVSMENERYARDRFEYLAEIDAPTFLSVEPYLGKIDFLEIAEDYPDSMACVKWIVAGCESGRNARPAPDNAFRDLRDQCKKLNIPFFLKQMMVNGNLAHMPELDGKVWNEFPY